MVELLPNHRYYHSLYKITDGRRSLLKQTVWLTIPHTLIRRVGLRFVPSCPYLCSYAVLFNLFP